MKYSNMRNSSSRFINTYKNDKNGTVHNNTLPKRTYIDLESLKENLALHFNLRNEYISVKLLATECQSTRRVILTNSKEDFIHFSDQSNELQQKKSYKYSVIIDIACVPTALEVPITKRILKLEHRNFAIMDSVSRLYNVAGYATPDGDSLEELGFTISYADDRFIFTDKSGKIIVEDIATSYKLLSKYTVPYNKIYNIGYFTQHSINLNIKYTEETGILFKFDLTGLFNYDKAELSTFEFFVNNISNIVSNIDIDSMRKLQKELETTRANTVTDVEGSEYSVLASSLQDSLQSQLETDKVQQDNETDNNLFDVHFQLLPESIAIMHSNEYYLAELTHNIAWVFQSTSRQACVSGIVRLSDFKQLDMSENSEDIEEVETVKAKIGLLYSDISL